jgi:hypothetical protein
VVLNKNNTLSLNISSADQLQKDDAVIGETTFGYIILGAGWQDVCLLIGLLKTLKTMFY